MNPESATPETDAILEALQEHLKQERLKLNIDTLLPCPHCGGEAKHVLVGTTEWVACTKCDAQTPHFFTHGQKCNGAPQKQQYGSNPAVKLWNMTAPSCYEQMPAAT